MVKVNINLILYATKIKTKTNQLVTFLAFQVHFLAIQTLMRLGFSKADYSVTLNSLISVQLEMKRFKSFLFSKTLDIYLLQSYIFAQVIDYFFD